MAVGIALLNMCFSLSLSQFQPIFVSFALFSAVLCHCFKAMSLVRIILSLQVSYNVYSYFKKGCQKKCAHDNPER